MVQARTIHGFRREEGVKIHLYPDCSALTYAKRALLVEGQYEVVDSKEICNDCKKRKYWKERKNK